MKSKKRSPFVGRVVSLVENDRPLLYPRYTALEQISMESTQQFDLNKTAMGLMVSSLSEKKRKISDFVVNKEQQSVIFPPKKTKVATQSNEMNGSNKEEAQHFRQVMGLGSTEALPSGSFKFKFPEVAPKEDNPSSAGFSVFIGGMPYTWSKDDVHEFWSECGEIVEVDCMTFHDTGRFRGIAKITYKTEEAWNSALACNGEVYEGFSFVVTKWKAKDNHEKRAEPATPHLEPLGKKVEGYDVLFLCNLPLSMTESDVVELFTEFEIEAVKLKRDPENGAFKGYAHVYFGIADDRLEQAIEKLNGVEIKGRTIRIGYAIPPPQWKPTNSKGKKKLADGMQDYLPEHFEVKDQQYLMFLSGLDPKMDKTDVEELLDTASIVDIAFCWNSRKKERAGSAYLLLKDSASVQLVLKKNKAFHKGRRLHMRPGKFTEYLKRSKSKPKEHVVNPTVIEDDPLLSLL